MNNLNNLNTGSIGANNQNQNMDKINKKLKYEINNSINSKKKMVCNFYINGACNKGKECTFSHDVPQIKKTELCKYFLTNACLKGDECVYSHETKTYPCKFFHAVGYCEKGENCR